jgi:hypothetical protein
MSILTFPWGQSNKVFCHGKTMMVRLALSQLIWDTENLRKDRKSEDTRKHIPHTYAFPTYGGCCLKTQGRCTNKYAFTLHTHPRFQFPSKTHLTIPKVMYQVKTHSSYVRVLLSHLKGCCMLLYIHDHPCTFLLVMICLGQSTFIVGMKYPECQVTMPPFAGLVVLYNLGCQISDRGNHRIWSCLVSHSIHPTPISHR